MLVNGKHFRTVWMEKGSVCLIDQTLLPFEFSIFRAKNHLEVCDAIRKMIVRGAGAIGAAAGYGMALAFSEASGKDAKKYAANARAELKGTRPTAVDLAHAVDRVYDAASDSQNPKKTALQEAEKIAEEMTEASRKIGQYGSSLLQDGFTVQTHCNAGWLAFVDWGSALSPVYFAKREGKSVFVLVDETRPRMQGAKLTAWELSNEKIDHAIISDGAAASFMASGKTNIVIVGADRIASNGDTANKIGTLPLAIVAKHFKIPFYVAAPLSTFDLKCKDGKSIPIEQRSEDEVHFARGVSDKEKVSAMRTSNPTSPAFNPSFDVTPSELIKGIITEKGIIPADSISIRKLFGK